jgi:hypothetical protein
MSPLTGLKILVYLGDLQRCRAYWRWKEASVRYDSAPATACSLRDKFGFTWLYRKPFAEGLSAEETED